MFTRISCSDLPSNIKDLHKAVCDNRLKKIAARHNRGGYK